MTECKRCGKCCHWVDGYGIEHACQYLSYGLRNGFMLAKCNIYYSPTRLGTLIAEGVFCIHRDMDPRIISGCPYNKE